MSRRKVFIAVNIDERTKKYIADKVKKINNIEQLINQISPENYHLTLLYVGFIDDENLAEICEKTKNALKGTEEFDFSLNCFFWGPKKENPKMLWIMGKENGELINLKCVLEIALSSYSYKTGKRSFKPHINLGKTRGKTADFNSILEEIKEKINLNISVSSVEIMESIEEKGKRKYYVLESIALS